jgi:hypothetical protein
MTRSLVHCLVGLSLLAAVPVAAQDSRTRVTLTVSPGFVDFAGYGGGFPAAVARLSVSRDFSRYLGGEVAGFVLAPMGGASAMAGCVAGSSCISTSTPNLLSGGMVSGYAFAGDSPLRISAGVGAVNASGGEGFGRRSAGALLLGIDLVPRTGSRFAPTVGIRVLQLASPLAGARQLILPGVGLSF